MLKEKFFETQGYKDIRKRLALAIIFFLVSFLLLTVYTFFYSVKSCSGVDCFVDSMGSCKKVTWVRQDAKASWRYSILGNAGKDICKVDVKLLKINQGFVENEKLIGKEMICNLPKGETQFPEEDLSICSGLLKEEMQEIIIQKMHNYLLENLGDINEEFKKI